MQGSEIEGLGGRVRTELPGDFAALVAILRIYRLGRVA